MGQLLTVRQLRPPPIDACVRDIREGRGYRVFQLRKPKNRHLIDVRPVEAFPPVQRVADVLVVAPDELAAWAEIVAQEIREETDAEEFEY